MKATLMRLLRAMTAIAMALAAAPLLAAPRTVTLSVPGMTCATCPITVRKALSRVPGVSAVQASLERRQAVVTFDDERMSVEALTEATANAGYPSSVRK